MRYDALGSSAKGFRFKSSYRVEVAIPGFTTWAMFNVNRWLCLPSKQGSLLIAVIDFYYLYRLNIMDHGGEDQTITGRCEAF